MSGSEDEIEQAVLNTIEWLDANQFAAADDMEAKQQELKDTVTPIITRAFKTPAYELWSWLGNAT